MRGIYSTKQECLPRRASLEPERASTVMKEAVRRGALGIDFDGCRQEFPTQMLIALLGRKGLKIEFDSLSNIAIGFFECIPLRLAPLFEPAHTGWRSILFRGECGMNRLL